MQCDNQNDSWCEKDPVQIIFAKTSICYSRTACWDLEEGMGVYCYVQYQGGYEAKQCYINLSNNAMEPPPTDSDEFLTFYQTGVDPPPLALFWKKYGIFSPKIQKIPPKY